MAQGREARAYNITIYVHKKSVRESTTCAAGRDAFWSGAVKCHNDMQIQFPQRIRRSQVRFWFDNNRFKTLLIEFLSVVR